MSAICLVPVASQHVAVATASAKFTNAMAVNRRYRLSSSTNCYFKVGATGGSASVGADSHFLGAGMSIDIWTHDATNFGFVHIIRVAADGVASLSEMAASH